MREQRFGIDYDVEGQFPNRYELPHFEGTDVWLSEDGGRWVVIIDERHHARGLKGVDEYEREILAKVVRVLEFDSEDERGRWLRRQLGG